MRHALFCVLGVAAVLIQVVLVDGRALPGGGLPDIALVLVVVVGLMQGPVTGMLTGFCTGLVLDLAPPGGYVIGGSALVFCLIGYLCGRTGRSPGGSVPRLAAAAVIAICAGELSQGCFGLVAGASGVTFAAVRQGLPSGVLYDLLMCAVLLAAALAVRQSMGGRSLASTSSFSGQNQPLTGPSFSRASNGQPPLSQPAARAPGGRVIRPTGMVAKAAGSGAGRGPQTRESRDSRTVDGLGGTRRTLPRPDLGKSALRARPGPIAKPVRLRLRTAGGGLRRQVSRPGPSKFRPKPAGSSTYRPARSLSRQANALRRLLPWIGARSRRHGGIDGFGRPR